MKNKEELVKHLKMDRYFKADSWRDYNKQFFNNLAEKYDAGNHLHSFGTKAILDEKVIDHMKLPKGIRILDCATGSADMAIKLSRRDPQATIIALDASPEMLKVAKRKIEKENLKNIELVEGDIMHLPYPDNYFDAVLISFGLRNLEDIQKGLIEMARVLKPGGIYSSIDQGKPKNILFKPIYQFYFHKIAPILGKLIFHRGEFNSFRYLPESNKFFPTPNEIIELMKTANFRKIEEYTYYVGAMSQQVGVKG